MATILIPPQMRHLTEGETSVEADGKTLRQLFIDAGRRFPALRDRVIEDGVIAPGISLAIDDNVVSTGLVEAVGPDAQITIVPQISGGMADAGGAPELEHLFDFRVELGGAYSVGQTPAGGRLLGGIGGGSFEGPRLGGRVEPIGGDFARAIDADTTEIDVRALLRTDDDALIYMTYTGIMRGARTVGRAMAGEDVDQSEVYWRTLHRFETASEEYGWLNGVVAVGVGEALPGGVIYHIFELG
jgi:hypothetical protein